MKTSIITILLTTFCFTSLPADIDFEFETKAFRKEFQSLYTSMSKALDSKEIGGFKHIINSVSGDGKIVSLKEGIAFTIDAKYFSIAKNWKKGDQLHISYNFTYHQLKLEHPGLKNTVWASSTLAKMPTPTPVIKAIPQDGGNYSKLKLSNGYVFKAPGSNVFSIWDVKDRIIILAMSNDTFQLWNFDKDNIIQATIAGNPIQIEDILGMEKRLNNKVLQQPEATNTVVNSLINYAAGLKNEDGPIGVFLFLGPTGVGKTELAKALTQEIYKNSNKLLRFDMTNFSDEMQVARLIGSPPGYVNHEEGGQLTKPLSEDSQRIVLLDEMEKAHPKAHKIFLPVFDEGYIIDNKNQKIDCSETIFIMTSNLSGLKIAELFNKGLDPDEVLKQIEPDLMRELSPELYNRVEPIVFRPLGKEAMSSLVDLLLKRLADKVLMEKQLTLTFDNSLKDYLMEKGYHPLLGARPLKKLIEKKVIGALAYSMMKEDFESGIELILLYDQWTDSVVIDKR